MSMEYAQSFMRASASNESYTEEMANEPNKNQQCIKLKGTKQ